MISAYHTCSVHTTLHKLIFLKTKTMDTYVVFLHCCPDCPNCPAHLTGIGGATWWIWVEIKKDSLSVPSRCIVLKLENRSMHAWFVKDLYIVYIRAIYHREKGYDVCTCILYINKHKRHENNQQHAHFRADFCLA